MGLILRKQSFTEKHIAKLRFATREFFAIQLSRVARKVLASFAKFVANKPTPEPGSLDKHQLLNFPVGTVFHPHKINPAGKFRQVQVVLNNLTGIVTCENFI